MFDQFDVAVHDAEALAEIDLLTDLIIAGTAEDAEHVSEQRIDEILGVHPGPDSRRMPPVGVPRRP